MMQEEICLDKSFIGSIRRIEMDIIKRLTKETEKYHFTRKIKGLEWPETARTKKCKKSEKSC